MSLTQIIGNVFKPRQKALEKHLKGGEALQRAVLEHLIHTAKDTEYGRNHAFDNIKDYEQFTAMVPVNTYEELKGDIDRMRHGERDVLWPGRVRWYAKSSGTTNDKSKFIPVSDEGLQKIHYAGGRDSVALYLRNNPKSRMFDGKGLILGGSHAPNYNVAGSLVGDLSAILIENINPLVNLIRVPKKETALLSDFEVKRERIAREAMNKNVTNISGVPSWMLSVLNCMMEMTGMTHLEEVWPNIEVFFHGGVAFTPYRKQYEQLITSPNMHYMETYNASEGFFGLQDDPMDKAMLLMLDYGVFYEFQELSDKIGEHKIVPLWGVEKDKNYAMLISTSCGLWRYMIGDTVRFTSTNPYKFVIVRSLSSIMQRRDWPTLVNKPVLRCSNIRLLLSSWTLMPSAATSGLSNFPKRQTTWHSLPTCWISTCRKSIATMKPSAIRTSPCNTWKSSKHVPTCLTTG